MSNIDRRIVDMQFNNREFEKGAGDTISTLDKLKKALNFDKSTDGLESLKSKTSSINLEGITAAVESLSSRFSTLGIIGVTALTNITNRAVDAGVALAKSLSVDQVTTGFSKYEQKTANMQTLLNSTGKSVEEVNGYLNQLMWFSDETSYGFTDMTAALSQMTSAGGDIEKLVPLITGVANSVAFSGKGAAEFSRAMYNLNQSYSSGSLNLMDMKSLDLAGVSSKQLKEELIAAGEALGTIEKGSVNLGNFNDTLNKKWANREVMEKAFGSFAELSQAAFSAVEAGQYETASEAIEALSGNYSDLSVKAFTAAQTAKSFSEAIDATKDAVSSGWMRTIEILFGDFEESKVLWTAVTEELWEVFAAGAGDRNEMLQGWKDLGGREKLIHGFAQAWSNLKDVFGQVSEAFKYVFPPMTSERLKEITDKFAELMEKLKPSEKLLEAIKESFKAFFSTLSVGVGIIKEVFGILIDKIKEFVGPHTSDALDFIINISKGITKFSDEVKGFDSVLEGVSKRLTTDILNPFLAKFGTSVEKIGEAFGRSKIITHLQELFKNLKPLETLSNIFNDVISALEHAYNYIKPFLDKIGEALATGFNFIKQRLADFFGDGNIKSTNMDILGVGVLFGVYNGFKKIIEKLTDMFGGGKDFKSLITRGVTSIVDSLDVLKNTLVAYQQTLKAEALKTIAIALGLLTASVVVLSMIDTANLAKAIVGVGALMAELVIASKNLGSNGSLGLIGTSVGLTAFATSILVLSVAVNKLADIPAKNLSQGLVGIGILIAMVVATTKTLKAIQPSIIGTSIGLTIFSVAINLLATSVKKLGMEDFDNIKQGLFAVGVLIAEVAAFTKIANLDKSTIGTAVGMIVISMALRKLANSVEFFGKMNIDELKQGMLAIGIMLGIISAFTYVSGSEKKLIQLSFAVGSIAGSIVILSNVIAKLGKLSLEEIAKGVTASGASIAIIGLALKAIDSKDVIFKAYSLAIVAGSLVVLQDAFDKFGKMELSTIAKGLIAMGGSLGILVVGLNGMKGTLGAALAVAAAAFALGLLVSPLIALGSIPFTTLLQGLFGIAGVFAVLGLAGVFLTPVIPVITSLALALLGFAGSLALLGASLFSTAIGLDMFAVSMAANSASFMIFMTTMLSLIPIFIQKIGEGIVLLIKVIGDSASEIVKSFMKIITAIMDAIGEAIPKVVETFMKIITGILKAVDKALPDIIKMGFNILKNFMKGIRDNIQEVVTLGVDIVLEFVKGINKKMSAIVDTAFKTIITFINSLADAIRNNKQAIFDAVWNLITAIIEAIFSFASNLVAKGGEIIGSVVDGMAQGVSDFFSSIFDIGKDVVGGFLDGIKDLAGGILEAGGNMVSGAIQGASNFLGGIWNGIVNIGKSVGEAFTDGVDGKESDYKKSGKDAVDSTKSGIKTTVDDTKGYVKSQGSTLGSMFAEGMTAGIKAKSASLRKSAEVAAADAISAARRVYQIESPSKVGIGIGKNWILGNIKGNEMMAGKLSESSSEIAQDSIDAMKKTLSTVVTQEDTQLFGMNPEITPFINLEKVKMGVEQLKDFFRNPNLVPAFSTQMAGNVSMANRYGRGYEDPRKQIDTKVSNQYHIAENSTFYVREEADIRKISEELAREIERKRRG